jgi:hypothetical protein
MALFYALAQLTLICSLLRLVSLVENYAAAFGVVTTKVSADFRLETVHVVGRAILRHCS